jgi:hypothetical protein
MATINQTEQVPAEQQLFDKNNNKLTDGIESASLAFFVCWCAPRFGNLFGQRHSSTVRAKNSVASCALFGKSVPPWQHISLFPLQSVIYLGRDVVYLHLLRHSTPAHVAASFARRVQKRSN